MKKTNEQLYEEFHALPSDTERWKWVKENQDSGVRIQLDNDDTYGTLPDDEEAQYLLQLDWFIGWTEGIEHILTAMGIEYDCV